MFGNAQLERVTPARAFHRWTQGLLDLPLQQPSHSLDEVGKDVVPEQLLTAGSAPMQSCRLQPAALVT
ncbi:hypothetical protein CSOJ01_07296 [Colletotrichum sojae]|uniref:Uncharacterized protein n=1 Tax=Colletotrichum sojae TaxID=2175907 RepID=A0A8H6J9K8_9PEZI|nr:hypothetical protein CSOJ01_07296 [Colletotrichum sojae]